MGFQTPRVNNDAIRLPGKRRTAFGTADRSFICDGMIVRFPEGDAMRPGDDIVVRAPDGEELDLFFGSVRPDGLVSVWYALHPELRHWLGWLEPVGTATWRFRMEPFHRDWQRELQAAYPDIFSSAG
jgi:hypothetical protein